VEYIAEVFTVCTADGLWRAVGKIPKKMETVEIEVD
jgi:hypothetical protein